ncbi:hypothetical protein [Halodurantibacterium flavum]|uniref:Uncharacterized protein n=1 Tax=Halodurantibacterium flavum TaxID=1382802 RepID=A0ABW4SBY7_9RHOB
MTAREWKDHDWPAVLAALQDLLDHSVREEPGARMFHIALQEVIDGLPEEAFQ